MRKAMLFWLVLALSAAGLAQSTDKSMATGANSNSAQTGDNGATIVVQGPVVADYGVKFTTGDPAEQKIAKEVRHELLMLPWYSLFDDLGYTVQGSTVTLTGTLVSQHAITKSDAENSVKRIEGVEKVVNNIQILPPSPMDDRIRERVFQKLVRAGGLSKYFWEAAPSVHIIVQNGRVTLTGYVMSEGDKNLAGITANGVPGTFQITNNLRVVKS